MNMNRMKEWMDLANRYSEGDFWKDAMAEGKGSSNHSETPEISEEVPWVPSVDVIRTMNETFVLIELPGIRKEDFELIVSSTQFIIKGIKPNRMLGMSYITNESYYGPFERIIPIPHLVSVETVLARLIDGILIIRFPAPLVKEAKISVL
ncbi:HSP20 family protein [Paenibacillus sp. GP183]|nr:HSP20 family protein [Paenibacillus sp. GP183]